MGGNARTPCGPPMSLAAFAERAGLGVSLPLVPEAGRPVDAAQKKAKRR